MAITATHLTGLTDTSNIASYVTASITPTANRLVLAAVMNSKATAPDVPSSVTGNGLTWVQVVTATDIANTAQRVTIFRAMGAAPSAGAVTADFAGVNQTGCIIHIAEFAGVDTGGTNGSAAAVQSNSNAADAVTSLTVTLAAFGSATNGAYGAFFSTSSANTPAAGSGFTTLAVVSMASPTRRSHTEWQATSDTSVDSTGWGSGNLVGAAVEIKEAPTPIVVTPTTNALTTATLAPTVTASDHQTVTPVTAALVLTSFAPRFGVLVSTMTQTLKATGSVSWATKPSGTVVAVARSRGSIGPA